MNAISPEQTFNESIAVMLERLPFWAVAAMRLDPRVDPTCKTAWTDGISIGYNPTFFMGLGLQERMGLLAHEVGHCILLHHTRRDARESSKWNVACDYALNAMLKGAGIRLPAGGLHDPKFDGLSAEQIYLRLPEDAKPPQGRAGAGEVRDLPGKDGKAASPSEIAENESGWAKAMMQASATHERKAGKGSLKAVRDAASGNASIDWRAVISRFVGELRKQEDDWMRPNRRYLSSDFIMPSSSAARFPRLLIAVDTSGSISPATLANLAQEICECVAMFADAQNPIRVLWADDGIAGIQEFDGSPLVPRGGGGTDFAPVMKYAAKHAGEGFAGLIYLTDGICTSFGKDPGAPVLWLQSGAPFAPPFGEVVKANF